MEWPHGKENWLCDLFTSQLKLILIFTVDYANKTTRPFQALFPLNPKRHMYIVQVGRKWSRGKEFENRAL